MKTAKLLPLMLIMLFSISVFGQISPDDKAERPYIEVKGTAKKEVIPDELFLALTIKERHEGKEKITLEMQEADLKQALMGIGIPLENLLLADASSDYTRIRWSRKDVIAEAQYMIKVWDAHTLKQVLGVLDELKIKDARVAKVSHSQIEELQKEVRIRAIKAAKDKADYLLAAIGEKAGKPMVIYELDPYDMLYSNYANVAQVEIREYMIPKEESDVKSIAFEHITLKSSFYVKFGIE